MAEGSPELRLAIRTEMARREVALELAMELEKRDDEVRAWAEGLGDLVAPINDDVQDAVSDILARLPELVDTRKNRSVADLIRTEGWAFH